MNLSFQQVAFVLYDEYHLKINQPGGRNRKKIKQNFKTKNQPRKELYTLKTSGEQSSGSYTLKTRENDPVG